jgi:SAM-dependent methyltransferase
MISRKNDTPRILLTKVRQGDYAHPGDEEAVDLLINKTKEYFFKKNNIKLDQVDVLDVGCGLGGTANYIKTKLHGATICGIDIDSAAVDYAKSKYHNIDFFEGDILDIDNTFQKNKFQLIYMFNVFYAISEQNKCLKKLSTVAKPGAVLAIFDYTRKNNNDFQLNDLSGRQMHPIEIDNLNHLFLNTGWEVFECVNLTAEYLKWYKDFLNKLGEMKEKLLLEFSEATFFEVYNTFSILLKDLTSNKIGGALVLSRLKNKF